MPFGVTISEFQQSTIVYLFEHEDKRLAGQIGNLAKDNDEICKSRGEGNYYGFIFDGVAYRDPNAKEHFAMLPGLDFSLNDRMEALMSQKNQMNKDIQLVRQALFNLLNPATTDQQARDTLPECLLPVVKELMPDGVPSRMDQPTCTIQDNPRALRQYEKILPLIEQYSATRLIFS